jgi:hypothetical protein
VSIASFNRINRKAEHEIRRAEGTVNFVWVERKERTSTGSGHKTVRSLEMRVGTDAKFTGMSDQLPNLINQGDEWIFYYTNYPFMFLSAEQVK